MKKLLYPVFIIFSFLFISPLHAQDPVTYMSDTGENF